MQPAAIAGRTHARWAAGGTSGAVRRAACVVRREARACERGGPCVDHAEDVGVGEGGEGVEGEREGGQGGERERWVDEVED